MRRRADAGADGEALSFTEPQTDNFGFATPPRDEGWRQGPESLSNADATTFSGDMLNPSEKDVGHLHVSCAITHPGGFDKSHQQCGTATRRGHPRPHTRQPRVREN